jgi:hypothetical protein
MRTRDKRIGQVHRAISVAPIRRRVLREAYEIFQWFGELPDEDQIADAVLRQALRGGATVDPREESHLEMMIRLTVTPERREHGVIPSEQPNVRESLFCEAMDANPYVRKIARAAIAVEVAHNGKVEDPNFAAHHGLPKHNSVAMHVLGYPQKWARPPYEEQAARLFARQDELRERTPNPNEDPDWFDEQADVIIEFQQTGVLPEDDLRREALLAHIELDALILHKRGRDVRELMALLDRASRAEGEEWEEALKRVCEMAAEGYFLTSATAGGAAGTAGHRT